MDWGGREERSEISGASDVPATRTSEALLFPRPAAQEHGWAPSVGDCSPIPLSSVTELSFEAGAPLGGHGGRVHLSWTAACSLEMRGILCEASSRAAATVGAIVSGRRERSSKSDKLDQEPDSLPTTLRSPLGWTFFVLGGLLKPRRGHRWR